MSYCDYSMSYSSSSTPPIYIIQDNKSYRQFAETPISSVSPGANAIYVDYVNGSDNNTGAVNNPLQTVQKALSLFRSRNNGKV